MLNDKDGDFLVRLARKTIKTYISEGKLLTAPEDVPAYMNENMGVFVTLNKDENLRGCIGYPEPIKPLINALMDVAIGAATNDPRFSPVQDYELGEIEIEVSVLTTPQLIEVKNPAEYLEKIEIGRDGLIIERGMYRGLLLPQVPVDWDWDQEEFLANTCMKAGMSMDCWLEEDVKIYSFQSQIFEEQK
jgi:uncharacterized protein (TIGR00296 family)